MAELPRRPLGRVEAVDVLERLAERAADVGGVERLADGRGEDEPVLLPIVAGGEPVPALILVLLPERIDTA